MARETIRNTYSKAAEDTNRALCCAVDYREFFSQSDLAHLPEQVLERNYGCGVPAELRSLAAGLTVLDLGPGLGRDCFIAAGKVGPAGRVYGLDMNSEMLKKARGFQAAVADELGYDNIQFLSGQFDVRIPLSDEMVDVIFSNCVNNLAIDKSAAYREMYRVLKPGKKLSFSDVVSYAPIPEILHKSEQAWADCVGGVLSFQELEALLKETGFHGIQLVTDYLWQDGPQISERYFPQEPLPEADRTSLQQVRLYSVMVEAFKPVVDPGGDCYFIGQHAMFHGPGTALHLDDDPDHLFRAGETKEVCEKTASILKSEPFARYFTVFEPTGEVEARRCVPGQSCC